MYTRGLGWTVIDRIDPICSGADNIIVLTESLPVRAAAAGDIIPIITAAPEPTAGIDGVGGGDQGNICLRTLERRG